MGRHAKVRVGVNAGAVRWGTGAARARHGHGTCAAWVRHGHGTGTVRVKVRAWCGRGMGAERARRGTGMASTVGYGQGARAVQAQCEHARV